MALLNSAAGLSERALLVLQITLATIGFGSSSSELVISPSSGVSGVVSVGWILLGILYPARTFNVLISEGGVTLVVVLTLLGPCLEGTQVPNLGGSTQLM